jgi:putative hydrolase of the HAD superfamily
MTGTGVRAVDGVLFDIDHTIIDTAGAFRHAVSVIREEFMPDVSPDRDPDIFATWHADSGRYYRQYTRGEIGEDEQRRLRADELHRVWGGPPVDEELYPRWNQVFLAAFESAWRAFDDAKPALAALADAGVAVGGLSNARIELQERKLATVGVVGLPVLVGLDTLGYGKPAPDVFREGCARLGTVPSRTAYVGDELDIDAQAAAAAGLVGVWLDRLWRGADGADLGVARIESLNELPGLLGLVANPRTGA